MRSSVMVLLAGLAAACGGGNETAEPHPGEPPVWCLVETRGLGAQPIMARQARLAPGVTVRHEAVPAGADRYDDGFSDSSEAAGGTSIAGVRLGDGTWLMSLGGAGPWWEKTGVLVQMEDRDSRCRVRSIHLQWWADVAPYAAWAELPSGQIRVDDADLQRDGVVRLAFELTGQLAGVPDDGQAVRDVRAAGSFTLRLRDSALAPLPPDLLETFASVQPPR